MQKDEIEIDGTDNIETQINISDKNKIELQPFEIQDIEQNNPQINTQCKYCLQPINPNAKICYSCGKHQSKFINFLSNLPIFIVIFAGLQVYVNILEFNEAKSKRLEAEDVLKKAEEVLVNTTRKAEEIRKKAELSLSVATKSLEEANNLSLNANNVLTIAQSESEAAIKKAIEAKQSFEEAANDVKINLNNSNERISSNENKFMKQFDDLTAGIEQVKKDLTAELAVLNARNQLIALADNAINNGDRSSFDELKKIAFDKNELPDRSSMARAEFYRVKSFYVSGTRLKDIELKSLRPEDQSSFKESDISTDILIKILSTGKKWESRGRAAQLLSTRKEKEVPEAFIRSMNTEKCLDVLEECIVSFCRLTELKSQDVFETSYIIAWWQKNKSSVESRLAKK